VAVILGGTSGLGLAISKGFAGFGADVVPSGRRATMVETAAAAIESLGRRSLRHAGDATDRASLEKLRDAVLEEFGRVDILVNSTGRTMKKPTIEVTDEEWRQVMGLNLDAVWMMSQIAGAHMVARRQGSIINIGSMSGEIVNRPQWQPGYNASKAAVHHLTKSLAAEWGRFGVRVNALAPGYMKTDMAPVDRPEFRRYWIEDAALERYGYPEELGGAVVFLASDASTFVTGSVLVVDGGYTVF